MAKQRGYFDELCLDVELTPGFSTSNYPIIAGGDAEIASGGSFSEVVDYATANDVDLVALDVEGRTAIDSLIVKPGQASTLADLKGKTIGVKGKIPPSVAAMLAGVGLVEGRDYQTVLLDGFDPVAHYHLDGIVGFPGYKSNEPGTLDRAGLKYTLFDPTKFGVPGSFGVLFARRDWVTAHPTAAEDFLRARARPTAGRPTPSCSRPRPPPAPASASPMPTSCRPSSTPTPRSACSAGPHRRPRSSSPAIPWPMSTTAPR
jgi:NitT/TauT family transport system substrate-binding protein